MSAELNMASGFREPALAKTGASLLAKVNFPQLLRTLGATSLLAAISLFLFQGWDNASDLDRYLLLFGHTVGLTLLGFSVGHWMKESKSARLLIMIALASIPANFVILGAFSYSQFHWGQLLNYYPDMARWQVQDIQKALWIGGLSLLAIIPITRLGFLVLARGSANALSVLFLCLNLPLLIPTRSTIAVSAMVVAMLILVVYSSGKLRRDNVTLATFEGFISRLLMYVPIALMISRNLWLYAADGMMFTAISGMIYILLRQISVLLSAGGKMRFLLELLSIVAGLSIAIGVCFVALDFTVSYLPWMLPLFALVFSATLFELSSRISYGKKNVRRLAMLVVSAASVTNLVFFDSFAASGFCLIAGLSVSLFAYISEQRVGFVLGVITLLVGLSHQLSQAFSAIDFGSWGVLAGLGIGAILIASVLERHGGQWKRKIATWNNAVKQWED